MNLVSSRLAARTGTRQLDALAHADQVADRVDRAVVGLWNRLIAVLQEPANPWEISNQVAALVHQMHAAAHATIHRELTGLAQWGHQSAGEALAKTLPVAYLKAVATGRTNGDPASWPLRQVPSNESVERTVSRGRLLLVREGAGETFPDVRQSLAYDCGAGAFRAVTNWYGVGPLGKAAFISLLRTNPDAGTRVRDIERGAHALGLLVRRIRGSRQLAQAVADGWPVICPIQTGTARERAAEQGGHYVTVIKTTRRGVRVQDPVTGRRSIPWRKWLRDWHDHDDDGRRYVQFGLAIGPPKDRGERRPLVEDEPGRSYPGAIALKLGLGGRLSARDRAGRLREPVRNELTDAQQRDLFAKLLFPPLSLDRVVQILQQPIAGQTWQQDLALATRLADPNVVAGIVAGGLAAGQTPGQIAALLAPAVQGVKTSARRIARTYGMQVAHRAQMDCHQQLGDLVVGYQVHALLDQHTRPEHAHRNGTIYYLRPEPGQLGMDQCPHPPLESDDSMAWNCRCWLSPVLRPVESIRTDPTFTNARKKLIPDPATYDQWFTDADDQRRRLAVGVGRYNLMQGMLGGDDPEWVHFVDPKTGSLLSREQLAGESAVARAERAAKVRAAIANRRGLIGQVATFGFVG